MRSAIGDHRYLVTFENPGPSVPDGEGGWVETWEPLTPATWRVGIRAATVRDLERLTAGTVMAHATHIVDGRYHPGVSTSTRIRWDDYDKTGAHRTRILQVNGVDNLEERDREMQLFCEEQLTPPAMAGTARQDEPSAPPTLPPDWNA